MTFSVGHCWAVPLVFVGVVLSGCLPAAPGDEEKEPYYLAGKSHINGLDYKGAIESFEKALEVNPKSAPAHFELAWLYDQKEPDPAAAIYHYERYLKLSPNSGKEDMLKTRILACKQQLAQSVALVPWTEKQQRDLEQLAEDNKRLREEVERWRASAPRQASPTNPNGSSPGTPRGAPSVGLAQPKAPEAAPLNPVNPVRPPAAPAPATKSYIVKAGDTPSSIARKCGVKLDALIAANPKLEAKRLRVGQTLNIPAP